LARFSPDGRHLAVQASDGGIWVFSTTRIPRVLWHSASVDTKAAGGILAYSPDGQRLLAQHGTDAPRVLDAASGRTTATLAGAARTTTVGAWVGDDRIVIGDAQGGVDSYSSSGGDRRRLTRLGDAVLGAAASPDGRTVAVSAGSTVEVLDAATGARIRTLSGHTQNVTALAYSSSGNYLLSGSSDGTARLWNVGTGTTLTRLDEPGSQIRAVAYDSAARTVIAGGRDSALYLSRCDVCISPSALADIAAQHTTRTLTDAERAEFGVGSLLK
jgi:WD40 repeat protein